MMMIWKWKFIPLILCITFFIVAIAASLIEELPAASDEINADLSPELIVEVCKTFFNTKVLA
jgi:uncharacterized protein YpmS